MKALHTSYPQARLMVSTAYSMPCVRPWEPQGSWLYNCGLCWAQLSASFHSPIPSARCGGGGAAQRHIWVPQQGHSLGADVADLLGALGRLALALVVQDTLDQVVVLVQHLQE